MAISECERGWPIARWQDAAAYFKGNEERATSFIHRLLHQHDIVNKRSGSLKSRYRFVQMIYPLPDIV